MMTRATGIAIGILLGLASTGAATELTASRDVSNNGTLTATPDSIVPQSDGLTYKWSDKAGNGSNVAADPDLDLRTYNLTRTGADNTKGITLNLHDGTNPGSVTWDGPGGGTITTRRASGDYNGGQVTITNAVDVKLYEINTRGMDTGNGANIALTHSGNLSVSNTLDSRGNWAGRDWGGEIALTGGGGASGTPTGALRVVGSIQTTSLFPRRIRIRGYDSVHAGPIETYSTEMIWSGSVPDNTVTINNIGTGGVEVTRIRTDTNAGEQSSRPDVTISTAGRVKTGLIYTYRGAGTADWVYSDAGHISITAGGNIEATGTLWTSARNSNTTYSRNAGNITIATTNGWIKVANITARNEANDASRLAGNVSLTASGDIQLAGSIDLGAASGGTRRGALTLTAGGSVSLNTLDISKVNTVKIDSGTGLSQITNTLSNFSTASSGGNGTAGDPFIATQTQLRLPAGERLYYSYVEGGLNSYLGGQAYKVADLAGTAGAGGLLMVQPGAFQGTVYRFQ